MALSEGRVRFPGISPRAYEHPADRGALTTLRPGTVVIDCSTAVPASTAKVAEAVSAKGGKFIDAPMTRTAKEAAKQKRFIRRHNGKLCHQSLNRITT